MPKVNVYLPDELAAAVRDAQVPVSAICQAALERAVRDVAAARGTAEAPSGEAAQGGLYGNFTGRARTALNLAQRAAREVPHAYVGTEHILLGVLDEGDNLALKVLAELDIDLDDLRSELQASLLPANETVPEGDLPLTPLARRALGLTTSEALQLGHNYIGCEHLLLGLISSHEGLASKVLRRLGVELRTTRMAVVKVLMAHLSAQGRPTALAGQASAGTTAPAAPSTSVLEQIFERLDAIERQLKS